MKKFLILFLGLIATVSGFSQEQMSTLYWRKAEADTLVKAQMMVEDQNYVMAIPLFEKMLLKHPKELYLKYMLGMCGLYRSDMHEKSLIYLEEVYNKNFRADNIVKLLARSYYLNYRFDDALALLDKYQNWNNLSVADEKDINQLIKYSKNAKKLIANPIDVKIGNIGDAVNTSNSEYVPLISSDESVMIFTYRGEKSTGGLQNAFNEPDPIGIYYEDVFTTHKENGVWTKATSIGRTINTNAHDAAIAISNDGQKLFIFKQDSINGGDIYMSKLDGTTWSVPKKLKGDVNTTYWEGSASLSADEQTLYFSSERPGGYGGKDLYYATLQADGSWGDIMNVGNIINTTLDEDAPFIHPDGKTLIFSSNGPKSMGGYDIFITQLNMSDTTWTNTENIGYPINTPDDDIYFVLSADGKHGYYASGKLGGYGMQDIYEVQMPDNFQKPVVAMVKGTTTLDNKPVEANIQVSMVDNNQTCSNVQSNLTSGNYLVNVEPGNKYKMTCKIDGFPEQSQDIDMTDLKSFLEKKIDINFSSAKNKNENIDSVMAASEITMDEIIEKYGTTMKDGLEFKVQVAAFKFIKNYRYRHLKKLGTLEVVVLEDGITRFIIGGSFKTIKEALEYKKKVIAAGQRDAFVTAIYEHKYLQLEELRKLKLFK